jgi:two-component sensor histidine kinase
MGQSALFQSCKEAEVAALREALKHATADLAARELRIETLQCDAARTQRAFGELHHRLKNSFHILCCALQLQEQSIRNTEAANAVANARLRIIAIGRVHSYLAGDDKPATVDFGSYTRDLCDAIATSLDLRCEVSADDRQIDSGTATSVGIIINELVINAAKHARPLAGGMASLRVKAYFDEEETLLVMVSDSGQGMPAEFDIDKSKSLGLRIVRSTVAEIGGTLSIGHDNGAVFTIRVPPPGLAGRDKPIS